MKAEEVLAAIGRAADKYDLLIARVEPFAVELSLSGHATHGSPRTTIRISDCYDLPLFIEAVGRGLDVVRDERLAAVAEQAK